MILYNYFWKKQVRPGCNLAKGIKQQNISSSTLVTFKKLSSIILLIQNMTEIKINTTEQNTPKMGVENCCNCHCHRVPVTLRDTFFQDPFFSGK